MAIVVGKLPISLGKYQTIFSGQKSIFVSSHKKT
jgi:hypothetical protein